MKCINCNCDFEARGKGYKRTALLSEKRSEQSVRSVLNVEVTPKAEKKDTRFLCSTCEKLLKAASEGQLAKEKLLGITAETSYISRKRKLSMPQSTDSAKKSKSETPKVSFFVEH